MSLHTKLAKRYIAGDTRADAIETTRSLNALGIKAAIDHLGENVTTVKEAQDAVVEYASLLNDIKEAGVGANVSLKLTHMGLDLSTDLAFENTLTVVETADKLGSFVRIDMEGSAYTQRTLDVVFKLSRRFDCVGVAIQASLLRSAKDIDDLIRERVSVRLVKGAYKEPPEIAYQDKKDTDSNFVRLMEALLLKGVRPAIATHDWGIVDKALFFAENNGRAKSAFDFEFLLGIKRTLQKRLAQDGYSVRVYVPYGEKWLPYVTRRLAERKENVLFVLRDFLTD